MDQISSLAPHKPFQWRQQHYLHEWELLTQGFISCSVLQEAAGKQEEALGATAAQPCQSSISRAAFHLNLFQASPRYCTWTCHQPQPKLTETMG